MKLWSKSIVSTANVLPPFYTKGYKNGLHYVPIYFEQNKLWGEKKTISIKTNFTLHPLRFSNITLNTLFFFLILHIFSLIYMIACTLPINVNLWISYGATWIKRHWNNVKKGFIKLTLKGIIIIIIWVNYTDIHRNSVKFCWYLSFFYLYTNS